MPTLELPSLHLPEAGVYLTAVMLWPRRPERYHQFVQAAGNTAMANVLRRRNPATIPPGVMAEVISAAAGEKIDQVLQRFAREDGVHILQKSGGTEPGYPRELVSGLLLGDTLFLSSQKGKPSPLESSVERFSKAGRPNADAPQKYGRSRAYVFECWNEFSPAAHLCAARLFWPDLWDSRSKGGNALALFLGYAEAFRKLGEAHRAPHAKGTLLDPGETWKLPEWVVLPDVRPESVLPSSTRIAEALAFPLPSLPRPSDSSLVYSADGAGHFQINAIVNQASVRFLVDTGATFVSLTLADAAAAGIEIGSLAFSAKTMTASGEDRAAPVNLTEVHVGEVSINNVSAIVVKNLTHSLLGMSFLNRLKGFEIGEGLLTIKR